MEYAVIRAVHPTWLSLQLPTEVAALLRLEPREAPVARSGGRGVSFLARGPGIVRVVPTYSAREILAIETVRNRLIAPARITPKLLFNLPTAVVAHLGLTTQVRGASGARSTDDGVIWFVPAPEYFEFRARRRTPKGWTGPSPGGLAHVYLARSVVPIGPSFDGLPQLESRIESEEWRPRMEALAAVGRRAR